MEERIQPSVSEIAEVTRASNKANQVYNAAANMLRIKKMYEQGRPDVSMMQFQPNTPALLIGDGSSLDELMPTMPNWKGLIFCSPQTYPTMIARGIIPSAVFAMDPSIEDVDVLRGLGDGWTTLITHQCIHPEMLEAWKGPISFMKVKFDDGTDEFMDFLYPWMRFVVGAQGCVANMAMIVAGFWKVNPLVMAGMDFADTNGKSHSTHWRKLGEFKWHPSWPPKEDPNKPGLTRSSVNDFYNLLMMCIWKGTGMPCYSVSKGILQMPQISWEDACNFKWPKPMDRSEMYTYIDNITIPQGVYGQMENGNIKMIEFAERLQKQPRNDNERALGKLWHLDDKGVWHRSMGSV